MNVPADLQRRCRVMAAQSVTDRLDPAAAIRLAGDLLGADVQSDTIVTLAGISLHYPTQDDTAPLVEALLNELDLHLTTPEAAATLLLDRTRQHVAGDLSTYELASGFWGLWTDTSFSPIFSDLGQAIDAWESSAGKRRTRHAREVLDAAIKLSDSNL